MEELRKALAMGGNPTGRLAKIYGKRIIPVALATTALGAILGGRIEDEM